MLDSWPCASGKPSALHASSEYTPVNELERLEVLMSKDAASKLTKATLTANGESRPLEFTYAEARGRLVLP